jgi:hypothetical protein
MALRVGHSCVAREMEENSSRGDVCARKLDSETGAGAADAPLMLEEGSALMVDVAPLMLEEGSALMVDVAPLMLEEGSALMVDVAPLRATPLDGGAELEEIQFSASLRL